jgi:hypothetical protein
MTNFRNAKPRRKGDRFHQFHLASRDDESTIRVILQPKNHSIFLISLQISAINFIKVRKEFPFHTGVVPQKESRPLLDQLLVRESRPPPSGASPRKLLARDSAGGSAGTPHGGSRGGFCRPARGLSAAASRRRRRGGLSGMIDRL